ncbi:MAG TPA: nitrilase-related carbon-nitrogen hydrolase, partial [Desulfobacterales bacterium]|nr:nitrilase-related carbon-nitrogen hydrolase [Desulfobacterales bacterium]
MPCELEMCWELDYGHVTAAGDELTRGRSQDRVTGEGRVMSTGIVSVVQAGSVPYNRQACLEKAADLAADAARGGAQLVVFPEAFVAACPKGLDFGARVGMRFPEGREEYRRYFESAVEVPSPASEFLGEVARKN